MNKINLLTFRNKYYKDLLARAGYTINEYSHPIDGPSYKFVSYSESNSTCIIEINNSNYKFISNFISKIPVSCNIIAIVKNVTGEIKEILLRNGIKDLIEPDDPSRLTSLLKILGKKSYLNSGKMIIFEDNNLRQKLLKNIIKRFNYEPHIVQNTDELFDNLKLTNLQFIFINIGINKLDLSGLIKNAYSRVEMKKIPVIVYKDMEKGLFVHEIVQGLNRLTKYILSIEELCSFLVGILYKKSIITNINYINNAVNFSHNSHYSKKTLNKIFYSNGDDLLSSKSDFYKSSEKIFNLSEKIQETIVKVDSLKWLIMKNNKADINTCGAGG